MALAADRRRTALVLRSLGLGDLLTAVPALRGVRAAMPDHRLVLATPAALAPLVDLVGAVDGVLPTVGLEPVVWSGPPPDVAVNLHGRGPESHRLLTALTPRRLVAFRCEPEYADGPLWSAAEHEVARWCRLVREGLTTEPDQDDLDLAVPDEPPVARDAVVVHPGAAFASRRWGAARFAEVCRILAAQGERVLVTGSAAESALVAGVVECAGLPPDANLAGSLDLRQLAALLASCRLLVSGDTGVGHLATAYRRPSVLLFGPVSPALWGPPPRRQHAVLCHGDGTGDPWGATIDPALDRITVGEVLDAVERVTAPG